MKTIVTTFALFLLAFTTHAAIPPSWTRAVEPVHIAGPIYYVGTEELGAYLIAGDEGLILLDVPLDTNAELVLRNVRTLGFDPKQIRILLNSHAHLDHIGGFARVQKETGAKIYLSAKDAALAARGGKNDFAFGDTILYPPVKADHIVRDGDTIRLGNLTMTALLTPGHTQGCTTWRTTIKDHGKPLDVVFLCSVTAPGYTLVNNEKYPTIFADYRASFTRLRRLDPDIFLANHAAFFDLADKRANKKPFIARGEFRTYLDEAWKELEAQEAKQRAKK
ncbi:MAG TPA: subclass B3 metallo-beta-lactamase [Thermoanaerobaculia bacterium]|nr:subclass B3 metallo-beta-lactamase [Thermoanaerobaculia bacterium]